MDLPEVPITTERLVLRPWDAEDVDALATAITESLDHLLPWMPWAGFEPVDRADRLALIAGWRSEIERGENLVVGLFHEGKVVGGSGLHPRIGPGGIEIGYWIHAHHTRKGFATEAAGALTHAALAMPGIDHVQIHHDRANVASAGVPTKLGFTKIDEVARELTAGGESGITCIWELRADAEG